MNNLKSYAELPYTRRHRVVLDDPAGRHVLAWIEEIPECRIDGETHAAAYANLQEVFEEFIQLALDAGDFIPTPTRSWIPGDTADFAPSELREYVAGSVDGSIGIAPEEMELTTA